MNNIGSESAKTPPNYLNNLLRERRTIGSSAFHTNSEGPFTIASARDRSRTHGGRNTSVAHTGSATSEMGFREIEDHVSKVKKENFNLKLEVVHRRQKVKALENELENFETLKQDNEKLRMINGELLQELEKSKYMQQDNEEILSINEELLKELEKRDASIKEAVGLIRDLEAKKRALASGGLVGDLPAQTSCQPPFAPKTNCRSALQSPVQTRNQPKHGQATALPTESVKLKEHLKEPRTPTRAESHSHRLLERAKSPLRTHSLLLDDKQNIPTLRGLYQAETKHQPDHSSLYSLSEPGSFSTLNGQQRDTDPDHSVLDSPRLSLLSESSFFSVFGKAKKLPVSSSSPEKSSAYNESSSEKERTSIKRLSQGGSQHEATANLWTDPRSSNGKTYCNDTGGDKLVPKGQVLTASGKSRERRSAKKLEKRMPPPKDHDRNKAKINRWIEDRETISSVNNKSRADSRNDRFTSTGQVVKKIPTSSREEQSVETPRKPLPESISGNRASYRENRNKYSSSDGVSLSLHGPIFDQGVGGSRALPPTPDTMSSWSGSQLSVSSYTTNMLFNGYS